ncbi:MAG: UDP-3-O-acyl-N-acetylglucosamine deacetylase [Thermoguttaceae bacterium]
MQTMRKQQTIGRVATVAGFGYWSGRDVTLEFRPADPNTGIVFVRRDLAGCPRIPATIAHRVPAPRRTSLSFMGARVDMVEHVLAALAGLQIDNCEVWADEAEMPGCDGSALPLVLALEGAGIEQQNALRPRRRLRGVVRLRDGDCWIEARPIRPPSTVLCYRLDYGLESPIGRQTFELALTPESFRRELAPSRTFMLKAEAEWLRAQGLGQRATARDLLVFDDDGPIDNSPRFPDECARHKLLDMVGDLALAGCDLVGRFTASKSGHRLNAQLVRIVLARTESLQQWRQTA